MNRKSIIRWLATTLAVFAGGVMVYAVLAGTKKIDQNMVFATHTLLAGTWDTYKQEYWEDETGRTLDKQQNDITTSEGQSYTMLRAVWMSDRPTFDKAWGWTKEQLQRKDDSLFSWRWGERADGAYGIFTDMGGQNAASDADSDIALALLMAAGRWQEKGYLQSALQVIRSIWDNEVVEVNGVPYLAANNLEKRSESPIVINPSYLSPYAYREFAKADKEHNWNAVVDGSYALIEKSMDAQLDKGRSAGLVPDWVVMDRATGDLRAPTTSNLTTNYSYDAIRTPWRLAMDYNWNNEPRAKKLLEKMNFLSDEWSKKQKLYSTYSHDGNVVVWDEVLEQYATALAYYDVVNKGQASEVYDQKIKVLYDQDSNSWKEPLTYYASNWVWFGIALHENQLPNLTKELNE